MKVSFNTASHAGVGKKLHSTSDGEGKASISVPVHKFGCLTREVVGLRSTYRHILVG